MLRSAWVIVFSSVTTTVSGPAYAARTLVGPRPNRSCRAASSRWRAPASGPVRPRAPPPRGRRARSRRRGGQRLARLALGRDAHHVPCEPELLEPPDDARRDVELPWLEAVPRRGREGVVVVVPGLAEGQRREPQQVARLVARVELLAAEEVAERVDRVGDVVQQEDAHEPAPQHPGQAGD